MIEFSVTPGIGHHSDVKGLYYDEIGRSFFAPRGDTREFQSILVNDLEIHTDAEGHVLFVDGYAPREAWLNSDALPPPAQTGTIQARPPANATRGTSIRLTVQARWPSYFNEPEQWLCVGEPYPGLDALAVKLQSDVVLVFEGASLCAVWLHVRPIQASPTAG